MTAAQTKPTAPEVPLFTYSNGNLRYAGIMIYDTDDIDGDIVEDVENQNKAWAPAALGQWLAETQPEVDPALIQTWYNGSNDSSYVLVLIWRVAYDTRNEKTAGPAAAIPTGPTADRPTFRYNTSAQLVATYGNEPEDQVYLFDTDFVRSECEGDAINLARRFEAERPALPFTVAEKISDKQTEHECYIAARDWLAAQNAQPAAPVLLCPSCSNCGAQRGADQPTATQPPVGQWYLDQDELWYRRGDDGRTQYAFDTSGARERADLANFLIAKQPQANDNDAWAVAFAVTGEESFRMGAMLRARYIAAKNAPTPGLALPTGRLVASIVFNPLNTEEAATVYGALRSLGYNAAYDGGNPPPRVTITPEQAAS